MPSDPLVPVLAVWLTDRHTVCHSGLLPLHTWSMVFTAYFIIVPLHCIAPPPVHTHTQSAWIINSARFAGVRESDPRRVRRRIRPPTGGTAWDVWLWLCQLHRILIGICTVPLKSHLMREAAKSICRWVGGWMVCGRWLKFPFAIHVRREETREFLCSAHSGILLNSGQINRGFIICTMNRTARCVVIHRQCSKRIRGRGRLTRSGEEVNLVRILIPVEVRLSAPDLWIY